MPRRSRIKLAEVPQHIVQRGINREPCFFAEEDYHCYLHWLQKSAGDWHCAIHAYALMTNHVHLLVTPAKPDGIAKLMQSIGRRYVKYNRPQLSPHRQPVGGTFQIQSGAGRGIPAHLLRYIELNSVRANMVTDPAQYRWSSYRHNGLGQTDERITPHPLYLALGKDDNTRLAEYRGLFRSQLDDAPLADIRLALAQGQPLGSERFSEIMCAAVGVRRAQRKPGRPMVKLKQSDRVKDQADFGF